MPEAIAKEDYYELNEFLMSASQHAKEGGLDISPRADEICKIRNQNLRKAKFNRLWDHFTLICKVNETIKRKKIRKNWKAK